MIRAIARRYPYQLATVLFIAVMTGVVLAAKHIVAGYGTAGTVFAIGAILLLARWLERRRPIE